MLTAPSWQETMPELTELLDTWHTDLSAWAIPGHITAAVTESPWVLPQQVFARRAARLAAAPSGPSFERAWLALDPPGEVLDVGAGAGAASLPLLPRTTALTAVDSNAGMLSALAQRATALGHVVHCVTGDWPQAARTLPPADVVTCHHVLYNAAEIAPFITTLTSHARRLVVAELTSAHPLTSLNELWLRFHGLHRPAGPTADDLLAIVTTMGLSPRFKRWQRPGGADYADFTELVEVTRRRLCLPASRHDEVAQALVATGSRPAEPADLGSSGRDVMTIWWAGQAA
jgi:SAM-dependent methyltransferase